LTTSPVDENELAVAPAGVSSEIVVASALPVPVEPVPVLVPLDPELGVLLLPPPPHAAKNAAAIAAHIVVLFMVSSPGYKAVRAKLWPALPLGYQLVVSKCWSLSPFWRPVYPSTSPLFGGVWHGRNNPPSRCLAPLSLSAFSWRFVRAADIQS
jgi:hypothetical protein